jgi:hypothetical protein
MEISVFAFSDTFSSILLGQRDLSSPVEEFRLALRNYPALFKKRAGLPKFSYRGKPHTATDFSVLWEGVLPESFSLGLDFF